MTQTQQELERLRTLQESFHDLDDKINVVLPALANKIDSIASRSVKYDKQTGNLTIENVELKINE